MPGMPTRYQSRDTTRLYVHGVQHPNAKISEDTVRQIRDLHTNGVSQRQLAREFNLAQSHINRIVNRRSWAHVA